MTDEQKTKSLLIAAVDFNSGIMAVLTKVVAANGNVNYKNVSKNVNILVKDYLKRIEGLSNKK